MASPATDTLVALHPARPLIPFPAAGRPGFHAVRRSEWVILAFQVYAAGAAIALPVSSLVRSRLIFVNLAVILIYCLLIRQDSTKPALLLSVIRDWLPLALILLAYREMGWFAQPHPAHALESRWVVWDRLVLRGGAQAAIEAFGPVFPAVLEIAYSLVYTLAPLSLVALYLYGRRDRVDQFLLIFTAGVLLCYAQFPFWPSEPPRVVFFGDNFPSYDTVFRRFNLWMLSGAGIHTSVFPSAHVGGAFSAAFGMSYALPRRKWVSRVLYLVAVLIAVATVYGRYHYLADAAAGVAVAAFTFTLVKLAPNLRRRKPAARSAESVKLLILQDRRHVIPSLKEHKETSRLTAT